MQRADVAEPRSPVPTRMISNGEYMPAPQTEQQKQVESRLAELAEPASKRLGISRRQFLAGSGGMAAALVGDERSLWTLLRRQRGRAASNRRLVPRPRRPRTCSSSTISCTWSAAAGRRRPGCEPSRRGRRRRRASSRTPTTPRGQKDELGEVWSNWNPALVGLPIDPGYAHITQFIKDVYLDSQVTIGLLSRT